MVLGPVLEKNLHGVAPFLPHNPSPSTVPTPFWIKSTHLFLLSSLSACCMWSTPQVTCPPRSAPGVCGPPHELPTLLTLGVVYVVLHTSCLPYSLCGPPHEVPALLTLRLVSASVPSHELPALPTFWSSQ